MKPLKFENRAWKGIRLETRNPYTCQEKFEDFIPLEICIGWHYSLYCFMIVEYLNYTTGAKRCNTVFLKDWNQVLEHYSKYQHNLDSFTDEVLEFMSEVISEKI